MSTAAHLNKQDDQSPIFSARDLAFEIEVTSAILRTLDIDQILYVVLSGVTSGEGLGYNRGLFMLADEGQRYLRTSMAVGPVDVLDAHRIWEDMEAKELTLPAILADYDNVKNDPTPPRLTHRLSGVSLSLDHLEEMASQSKDPESSGVALLVPMIARCLKEGKPLSSKTLLLEVPADENGEEPFRFRHWWIIPLLTPEHIVGILVVDDAFSDRAFGAREKHLLVALANLTAIAVEKGRLFQKMRALAEVDGLTGLANRRTYDGAIDRVLTQSRQTGRAVSLVIFDVDHFKQFNDRHGHLAGDDALKTVASILSKQTRRSDLLARYGGEEFVLLLPETNLDTAILVAEKMVTAVREQTAMASRMSSLTISAGVASSPAGFLDRIELFSSADRAVYEAKRKGRNRVESAPPITLPSSFPPPMPST